MKPTAALSLALLVAAGPVHSQSAPVVYETVPQGSDVDSTTQTDDVAVQDDGHDRMTVPVRFRGAGPFDFLVDTGADRTAVSRELAQRLNLAAGHKARLHSVSALIALATASDRIPSSAAS